MKVCRLGLRSGKDRLMKLVDKFNYSLLITLEFISKLHKLKTTVSEVKFSEL